MMAITLFLVQGSGRKPWNSINFVCAHDGFTLADLVTYNNKHNLPNGEDNNDGENHNNSWNCGQVDVKKIISRGALCYNVHCMALSKVPFMRILLV